MSDAHTLFSEGRQLMNSGQHEAALQKLGAALEADPNHALTHLTLCRLLSQLNQHDKAIEHGERACQLEPGEQINFTVLSVTYQKRLPPRGTCDTWSWPSVLAIGAWALDLMSSTSGISRRNAVRRLVVAVLMAGAVYWSYRHAALLIAIVVVVPVYWGWSKLSRLRAGFSGRGKRDRLE